MSIRNTGLLKKKQGLEGMKLSGVLLDRMRAAEAEEYYRDQADQDRSMGTMAGAVGPFALDKGYDALVGDEAAKEGLSNMGPQNPNMAPPVKQHLPDGSTNYTGTGQEFNAVRGPSYDQAVPKDVIARPVDAAIGGGGPVVGSGPGVGNITAGQADKLLPISNMSSTLTPATGNVGLGAAGGANSALGAAGTDAATTALNTAITTQVPGAVAPVGAIAPVGAAAPAGAIATGAAGLGAGLGGAAGAYGGKALAAEFTDDPTIQGVASVGGGALGGAAAGAAIGSAGGPIGAPIGAIIGAIGGLLGAF